MYTTNGQSLGASFEKNIYSGFEILSYVEHAAWACSRNHGGAKKLLTDWWYPNPVSYVSSFR